MKFYTYGNPSGKSILFIPGIMMTYRQFETAAGLLKDQYHVIVAGLDGFDESEHSEFPGFAEEASNIAKYIRRNLGGHVDILMAQAFGCGPAIYLAEMYPGMAGHMILSSPRWTSLLSFSAVDCQTRLIREVKKGTQKFPQSLKLFFRRTDEELARISGSICQTATRSSLKRADDWSVRLCREIPAREPVSHISVSLWLGSRERGKKKLIQEYSRYYPSHEINIFDGMAAGDILEHPEIIESYIYKILA